MIKNILIPTDFSQSARQAVDYAIIMAKAFNAEIILLHLYHFLESGTSVMVNVDDVISKAAHSLVAKELSILQKEHPRLAISSNCIESTLAKGIKKSIKNLDIDLLIMGTKGANDISRNILGSNTSQIIGKIQVPLIVVPKNTASRQPHNILIATDLIENNSLDPYKPLQEISNKFHSKLDIISVIKSTNDNSTLESRPIFAKLKGFVDMTKTAINYIVNEDTEKGIISYIDSHEVDLLTVLPKKKGIWKQLLQKSISSSLVKHSTIPILVLCS